LKSPKEKKWEKENPDQEAYEIILSCLPAKQKLLLTLLAKSAGFFGHGFIRLLALRSVVWICYYIRLIIRPGGGSHDPLACPVPAVGILLRGHRAGDAK